MKPDHEPSLLNMEEPIRWLVGLGLTIEDLGCEAGQSAGASDLRMIALGRIVHDLAEYLDECFHVAATGKAATKAGGAS